jgi:hypothetical protein
LAKTFDLLGADLLSQLLQDLDPFGQGLEFFCGNLIVLFVARVYVGTLEELEEPVLFFGGTGEKPSLRSSYWLLVISYWSS